jgi:hypothetical protein
MKASDAKKLAAESNERIAREREAERNREAEEAKRGRDLARRKLGENYRELMRRVREACEKGGTATTWRLDSRVVTTPLKRAYHFELLDLMRNKLAEDGYRVAEHQRQDCIRMSDDDLGEEYTITTLEISW